MRKQKAKLIEQKSFERNNPSKMVGSDSRREGHRERTSEMLQQSTMPSLVAMIWGKENKTLYVVNYLQNQAKRIFKKYLYPKWFRPF